MNKKYIVNKIKNLNKILNEINESNLIEIKKLHKNFLKNEKNDIYNFIINLSNLRKDLKNQILKYERIIMEIDKNIIEKKNYNKKYKNQINDKLYNLHKANDNIKITLKNILLKIK